MFACCCPQEEAEESPKTSHLEQSLIEKHLQIDIVQTDLAKQSMEDPSKRELPVNKNLLKMNETLPPSLNGGSNSIKDSQIEEDEPVLEVKNSARSISKIGSFQQAEKLKKKSEIWEQQSGTKVLYFVSQKEEEMIFVFKIIAVKTIENNPLTYALNPFKHSHKIRTKPQEVSLNFIIWNKSISETKSAIKNIENDSYIRTIFGVYKKEDELKASKTIYETDDISEILVMGSNCVRLQLFDKIIISCVNEKDIKQILSFCQKNTEFFELDDLSKTIFIFPPELTLSDINLILSRLLRKHLISQKLEHILRHLGYYVELVQSELFEPVIIVKSSLLLCQQEEVYSKEFEIKLQLAIGLLTIEINYNNFKAYEKVLDSFFVDMTIIKYLKLIQFIHKEKKDYLNKLEQLKLFENNQLAEIKNSNKIEERTLSPTEKCIIIKHRIKKRMGELFADYRSAQTPIEESQKKKKEWDDDLRENDIRVTQLDKNHQEQIQDNCNIFQQIDDSFVDNASLDIIASLDFKESD